MSEPSLQAVLREKYNITDRLLAEGKFVGLLGDHATGLVCLGLGIRCLMIARVVLSGDVIDYDLLSLVPLKILSLSYQNTAKKIKIQSQFKQTQVYQMCSSANQAEIWDNFTSTIREVYMPEQGDIWCSPTLQPPKGTDLPQGSFTKGIHLRSSFDSDMSYLSQRHLDNLLPFETPRYTKTSSKSNTADRFEKHSVNLSPYSSISTFSQRSGSLFPKFDSWLSESSQSLPSRLPSEADDKNEILKVSRKCRSMADLDIKFEQFVNDAPSVSNQSSYMSLTTSLSADDIMYLNAYSADKLNISNNFIEVRDSSNTILSDTDLTDGTSDGRLVRRILSCCSKKSKR